MQGFNVLKDQPFPDATTKIEPPITPSEEKPMAEAWSTKAADMTEKLAHESELQAAQAEIDAKNKLNLFSTDGTAAEKVAADDAALDAKEMEKRAQIAEEIASETAQWATEQGELRMANHILEVDPNLYETDSKTTLPR